MSFVPMSIGGGGQLVETVLWTNDSPTSTFNAQNMVIDTISKYDYIVIEVRQSTTTDNRIKYYYKSTDLPSYISGSYPCPLVAFFSTNNYFYYRQIAYVGVQTISIGAAYRNTTSSAPGVNNSTCIPTQIIGINIT